MRKLLIAVLSICSLTFGQSIATTDAAGRKGQCSSDFTVLGQMPGLTGTTPTEWFNVFGDGFSTPAFVTFDHEVIPYSIEAPAAVQRAVSEFTMPPELMSAVRFKMTFRSREVDVSRIKVTITGPGCSASTVVDLALPDTAVGSPTPRASTLPLLPIGTAVAFLIALFVSHRRLSRA